MDKTIINLLFNYKGTISSREFRAGMSVLFMTLGCYIYTMLNNIFPNIMMQETAMIASYSVYGQIISSYIPQMIPIGFILTVPSFLLTFKRARTFFDNKGILILSGILNFLFFSSIVAPMLIASFIGSHFSEAITESVFQYMLLACSIILVLGFINIIILALPGKSEPKTTKPTAIVGLDVLSYTLKVGNLIGISTGIYIILSFLFAMGPAFQAALVLLVTEEKFVYLPLMFLLIILSGFHIKYSVSRLKNAGISVLWLVGVLTGYVVLVAISIWVGFHKHGLICFVFNTVLLIATNFFLASQYLLLLLPTKRKVVSFKS